MKKKAFEIKNFIWLIKEMLYKIYRKNKNKNKSKEKKNELKNKSIVKS